MELAKELSKKEKIQGRIFIGTLIVIIGVILFFIGKCEDDYVKKNGVWTILTVDKITISTNGGSFSYHFTFKGDSYKGGASGANSNPLIKKGRRLFMMVVPDETNRQLIVSKAVPDWFTAEAPYDGWKSFPTDDELWAEMKAQGAEPGQPKDWSDHPNKRLRTRTRIVTCILVTIGCGFITFLYLVDKKKIKL